METVISSVYFVFESRQIQNLQLQRVPYNKLLNNQACLSRTGEYWPSIVFVPYCHNLGPMYSPVRPSCAVSKKILLNKDKFSCYGLLSLFVMKNKRRGTKTKKIDLSA